LNEFFKQYLGIGILTTTISSRFSLVTLLEASDFASAPAAVATPKMR